MSASRNLVALAVRPWPRGPPTSVVVEKTSRLGRHSSPQLPHTTSGCAILLLGCESSVRVPRCGGVSGIHRALDEPALPELLAGRTDSTTWGPSARLVSGPCTLLGQIVVIRSRPKKRCPSEVMAAAVGSGLSRFTHRSRPARTPRKRSTTKTYVVVVLAPLIVEPSVIPCASACSRRFNWSPVLHHRSPVPPRSCRETPRSQRLGLVSLHLIIREPSAVNEIGIASTPFSRRRRFLSVAVSKLPSGITRTPLSTGPTSVITSSHGSVA